MNLICKIILVIVAIVVSFEKTLCKNSYRLHKVKDCLNPMLSHVPKTPKNGIIVVSNMSHHYGVFFCVLKETALNGFTVQILMIKSVKL